MPSKSPKQAKLMRAVAHGWHPDQFKGPSVKVAKEFMHADERKNGKTRDKARRAERRGKELNKWAQGRKSNVGEYST